MCKNGDIQAHLRAIGGAYRQRNAQLSQHFPAHALPTRQSYFLAREMTKSAAPGAVCGYERHAQHEDHQARILLLSLLTNSGRHSDARRLELQ